MCSIRLRNVCVCVRVCVCTHTCVWNYLLCPVTTFKQPWNKVGPKIFSCLKESALICRYLNRNLIFSNSEGVTATNQLRSDQGLLLMHLLPRRPDRLQWLGFVALLCRLWALGMFCQHQGDLGSASWCHSCKHCKLLFWNIKSICWETSRFFEKAEVPLSRELMVQPYFLLPPSSKAFTCMVSLTDTHQLGPPNTYPTSPASYRSRVFTIAILSIAEWIV